MLRVFVKREIKTAGYRIRDFSTRGSLMVKSHQKANLNTEEVKEQKMFDRNKKKLERLEHDSDYKSTKAPSEKKLQEKGRTAPIEQNRPDDGVY